MKLASRLSSRPALIALCAAVVVLVPAAAAAKGRPPGGGGGGGGTPFSTTSTYVKNYGNLVGGVETNLTPEDVQATPDGGWTALALTITSGGAGVSVLTHASATGAPQWQEEIGCLNGAPGDYGDEVSFARTADGGYVAAGGTIGCGSAADCPELSGLQCGLIERLDGAGALLWARVYSADVHGTVFNAIRQTSDGGFVAAGSANDASNRPGGLLVKLDANGNVQWQREFGPTSTSYAQLEDVQQASDGGYVAAGEFNDGSSDSQGRPRMSVFLVEVDAAGNLLWQDGFNAVNSAGLAATEHVLSLERAGDGGYALAGDWNSSSGPGTCCQGPLLLKLSANGSLQWQKAYSGGVYCFFNGFSETCTDVGGTAYAVHQTADGGYVLAGQSTIILRDETPFVPWLAKVDGNGSLVWQENVSQVNSTTGRPLSQYFAAAALTPTGPFALGSTDNYANGLTELLGAQTDASGAVGTCSQVEPATLLSATDPGLVPIAPGLAARGTPVSSQSPSPAQRVTTTARATAPQC